MRKKRLSFLVFVFLIELWASPFLWAQLTIKITSVPNSTPSGDPIYIAGNFNNWDPANANYIFSKNGDGSYQISFYPPAGTLEYKFTRGSWTSVEGNQQGLDIANRVLVYTGSSTTVNVQILSWLDAGSGQGTAADNVFIIDDNFWMPQLNRSRRIWVYLPPDYASSIKKYPALYMQDGQNLFDLNTSYSGEWEVDESLNKLFDEGDKGVIVVGIDNGGLRRIDEYSPWVNELYGGGEGDDYVNFLIETLKPYIDSHYRTKADRLNTGIFGSSLGGLISFYAAIKHQDVFSKAGVFSPSFWFSDEVYTLVQTEGKQADMSIYLLGGEQEDGLVQDLNRMFSSLHQAGFADDEIKMLTHADGQHSEWYWRREFPAAYQWLFNKDLLSLNPFPANQNVKIGPNPFSDFLKINTNLKLENGRLEIDDVFGKSVYSGSLHNLEKLDLKSLKNGLFFVKLIQNNQIIYTQKLLHIHK
jgi:predicted alpha/beta superfamily hydrolase